MKNFIIFIIFILGLCSCSHKIQPPTSDSSHTYSAQVKFLYKDAPGTIGVNSTGFGKDLNGAITDAQLNAFNIILFKGIPGTELNVPLIDNEDDAKAKNSEYFRWLFDQGHYSNFLMVSNLSTDPSKTDDGYYVYVDLKINYNSLRKDLEQNNVIRKFGF